MLGNNRGNEGDLMLLALFLFLLLVLLVGVGFAAHLVFIAAAVVFVLFLVSVVSNRRRL